jgi:hypothetical protein
MIRAAISNDPVVAFNLQAQLPPGAGAYTLFSAFVKEAAELKILTIFIYNSYIIHRFLWYFCATILILCDVAQGVLAEHLSHELGVRRLHLLERRHQIQQPIQQGLSPLTPPRRCHPSR